MYTEKKSTIQQACAGFLERRYLLHRPQESDSKKKYQEVTNYAKKRDIMTNSETAKIFKAFCDEKRLEILTHLREAEHCATELSDKLNIGNSTLSHHMKILYDSGIVNMRKEGTFVYYSISEEGSEQARKVLDTIMKVNKDTPDALLN